MSGLDSPGAIPPHSTQVSGPARLRDAAERLEATFLSEMLKAARFGETPSAFGGGTGEDQFASFLRDAQATALVEAGGIGLAERLFQSLANEARDDT